MVQHTYLTSLHAQIIVKATWWQHG